MDMVQLVISTRPLLYYSPLNRPDGSLYASFGSARPVGQPPSSRQQVLSCGTLTYDPHIASPLNLWPPFWRPELIQRCEVQRLPIIHHEYATNFDLRFRPSPYCRKCDSGEEQHGTKSFPSVHLRSSPGATSLQERPEEAQNRKCRSRQGILCGPHLHR